MKNEYNEAKYARVYFNKTHQRKLSNLDAIMKKTLNNKVIAIKEKMK